MHGDPIQVTHFLHRVSYIIFLRLALMVLSIPAPFIIAPLKYPVGGNCGTPFGTLGTVANAAGPKAALKGVAGSGVTYPELVLLWL